MTIRRGEPWGDVAQPDPSLRVVPTDRHAREWVVTQRERGAAPKPVGLGGGDLAKKIGLGRKPGTVVRPRRAKKV